MSFAVFVRASERGLLQMAFVIAGDVGLAEDLVQTAFMRAYSHWARIKNDAPLGYTRRIIVNANHDLWRRGRHRESALPELMETSVPDRADSVILRATIVQALRNLSLRERRVIVLRYLADMSESQVAHELGMSIGTVKSTSHRAIYKLRASPQFMQTAQEKL